jgi:hypothetical protein
MNVVDESEVLHASHVDEPGEKATSIFWGRHLWTADAEGAVGL